jgi:membrane AbrB-like protein
MSTAGSLNSPASTADWPIVQSALRWIATALLGIAGGALFNAFQLPLAWMLGALSAVAIAAFARVPVQAPPGTRAVAAPVIGVAAGAAFGPDVLLRAHDWWMPLAAFLPLLALSNLAGVYLLPRLMAVDRRTAYLSSLPGGLAETALLSHEAGADTRAIVVVHVLRIVTLVAAVPFIVGLGQPPARLHPGAAMAVNWVEWALLALCGLAGLALAVRLRIRALRLLAPLAFSATLHMAGIVSGALPPVLLIAAQLAIGTEIGCKFRNLGGPGLARLIVVGAGWAAANLLLATAAAALMTDAIPFADALISLAPGGNAEMNMIALALGVDVAMVASCHAVRILIVHATAAVAVARLR